MQKKQNKRKIEFQFRVTNIVIFISLSMIMLTMMFAAVSKITTNVSKDYALLYSTQTIGKLNTYLSHEIGLMSMASQSKIITDWFADETNERKKRLAFEEMKRYIGLLYSDYLYFGINTSKNEYSLDVNDDLSDMVPYDVLDSSKDDDKWFFQCLSSEHDYLLNIDIDKLEHRKRVWLNHKVINGNKTVAVLCTGLLLGDLIEDLFKDYDYQYVRGIVIDEHGLVQMDSAMLNEGSLLFYEKDYYIEDYINSEDLNPSIYDFINNTEGNFDSYMSPEVVKLDDGQFSYAAITPIQSTDWKLLTFYSSKALFHIKDMLPVYIIMILLFVAYAAGVMLLTRKLIFTPFHKLIDSLENLGTNKNAIIYGGNSDDEIGTLSRTIQKMKKRLDSYSTNLEKEVEERTVHLVDVYKQIAEREKHLSKVFDNIHVGMITFNTKLEPVSCNNFCLHLFQAESLNEIKELFANHEVTIVNQEEASESNKIEDLFGKLNVQEHLELETELCISNRISLWVDLKIDKIPSDNTKNRNNIEVYITDIQAKKEREFHLLNKVNFDKLTNAYTRSYMEKILPSLIEESERLHSGLCLAMLDIDHFKTVNDTYGHDVGDIVLKETADLVRQNIRKSDILVRFGGEEFLIFMQNTNLNQAKIFIERLRKKIAEASISHVGQITVSFGISQKSTNEDYEVWFKHADTALYMAKEGGRNQVIIYDSEEN